MALGDEAYVLAARKILTPTQAEQFEEYLRKNRDGFPCAGLKQPDRRYRTKYGMSMIENLEAIKESGIRKFIQKEKKRWTCPECGGTICIHRPQCPSCGRKWR